MIAGRVLVVEDDPDILEYVSVLLEDNSYSVEKAECAEDAKAALEEKPIDLVIIDVILRGRSGLDLLLSLRTDKRWKDVPVVMVTGNDQVLQDGGKSYLSAHPKTRGADAVLGKPLEKEVLLSELRRLIPA
jgi:CheY-like chemotaxis protein